MGKLRPEVEAIIERQSKIDWSNPPHNKKKVIAAYNKRLEVTKLERKIRWVNDPEDASAASAASADWDAWAAIGYMNLNGNDVTDNVRELIDTYSPMIDAFEGGAFYHVFGEHEIVVVATPDIHTDDNHQLHREDGPALEWPKTKVYYWHGVEVPSEWIEDRENLDPNDVIKVENVEQRAVGASIVGWAKMLDVLDAKVIHDSGSNDIGQLIELMLPGLPEPGRFLKAHCPRNGIICEGIPYTSDIDGLPIRGAGNDHT